VGPRTDLELITKVKSPPLSGRCRPDGVGHIVPLAVHAKNYRNTASAFVKPLTRFTNVSQVLIILPSTTQ
jgi:hypothetical protein